MLSQCRATGFGFGNNAEGLDSRDGRIARGDRFGGFQARPRGLDGKETYLLAV